MQKIRIDFDNPGLPQHISAVENDSQSRFFQATLYENGKAYTAPEGATYSIMYRGFGPQNQGWYDTINDGAGKRAACAVSGNVVTCEIARQALQVPGHVSIVLCVTTGKGYMLKSWPIECDCKNDRYDSTAEIQSFFYVTQISNESWTQAIQAVEELKNTIDPTLSLSGKAADAAKVGEAVNAEAERAKGVEGQLKEDLGEQQTEYAGMIKFQRGIIDGNEIKYSETRIACTELPTKWISVTANDGYDIRAAIYDASGALLGYNLNENVWSERTISKSKLKQLYPDFSYAWLQIKKEDNSSITLIDATKSISFVLFPLENKKYIDALEYGFYNYGNIPNDDVMDKYLKSDSEKELYFPKGVYLFRKRIEVTNGCKIRMDSEAELKLSRDIGFVGGHFFIFGDKSRNKRGSYIIGGIINADFVTNSVVCLDSIQSARIENCILKNANQYGIQTGRTQDLRASDFYMHGCQIVNEKYVQGATGIFDNAYDNSFDNVTIVDFPIGIETASSKFNRVHMWLSSATFIPNSIGIILDNSPSCFVNCTIDTYQRGVISRGTKHYEFNSSNLTFFLNTDVYTKEIANANPPVVFHQVVMSESFTSLPILHCHGITINEAGYDIKLSDFEYPEDLLKKVWCSGVTQNDNIKNDMFTAEKRLYAN